MNSVWKTFLAICAGAQTIEDPDYSAEEWRELFEMAARQELLPMVLEACLSCASQKNLERGERKKWRDAAVSIAVRQIVQTNELLTLILHAQDRGLDPIVVKGIVCRVLYPKPYLRFSVDEDIFIKPEESGAWHDFLLSEGYDLSRHGEDADRLAEPSFHKEGSALCIELHKYLFPPDSEAFKELNRYFSDAYDHTVTVSVEDVTFKTLLPTDHFLFLILHAYKHFLYSGFGIRQVMDMSVFIGRYGQEINWKYIRKCCDEVHADVFAAAVLKIAEKYLGLPAIPEEFGRLAEGVDEEPLLADMISGGLYGVSNMARAHSSNITLKAAEDQKTGRRSLLPKTLFPGIGYLKLHFPYARKYPLLLPAAWLHRIVKYLAKDRDGRSGNPLETLKIGRERVELLKKYGIIDGQ